MSDALAWGTIGTGMIARTFAKGLASSKTGRLVAVGSRSQTTAAQFASEFNVPRAYGRYEDLLADADVEAVYICTPHPMHAEWAIKAAEAGKHVLCEKPIGLNHAEAMAIVEAARRHDVFLMEAFMYRCHPQTARLVELIRDGAIGEIRVIQAAFSFRCPFDAESRLYRNDLGGGGILDVGCYCTSMARLVAGTAIGQEIAEPIDVKAVGHLGSTGVDEYTVATLKFPGDIIANLATGVAVTQDNVVRIFGTEGHILVPSPWIIAPDSKPARLFVHKNNRTAAEEIVIEAGAGMYAIEADTVAAHIEARQAPSPAMTWNDTLGNMKTLDRWREAIGLVYESERIDAHRPPLHNRPLKPRGDEMRYGKLPGIELPVSRLVMGVDYQTRMPHTTVMLDDYFERGGNCFDTAHIYGGGLSEQLLGQWISDRGIREQVIILDKGAHTPWCNPDDLTRQLHESLDRLGTDCIDLYMMHRDNTEVPVGEFIDVLNDHQHAGRLRSFGVSNWTVERIEAANVYAQANERSGIVAVSNQLSLARMVEPPWPGCLSAGDRDCRAWHAKTQMPLMPWSSQARGFFAGRSNPAHRSDADLVRCWYSEDNFERLTRAQQLASKHQVPLITMALAYVLCQPFPTFPLIGPRTLSETVTSLEALNLALTPQQLRWLNLED